jgi:hypothetical protein
VTPVDPSGTPAVDPRGRGASERGRQHGRRPPRTIRSDEPDADDQDERPRPAPGRIDVIA